MADEARQLELDEVPQNGGEPAPAPQTPPGPPTPAQKAAATRKAARQARQTSTTTAREIDDLRGQLEGVVERRLTLEREEVTLRERLASAMRSYADSLAPADPPTE